MHDEASKMFDDLKNSPREQDELQERRTLLDKSGKIDTRKVFDGDESVK